ncbi:hypothetical protein FRB93_004240 [Tulasnella sp. JGI-2019a]|nr:hypothetical protein FRB93_004240 [Tulasnella sp. JGI-2019a]
MLGDLADRIKSPILKLVGKCPPRHFHQAVTVAKHCFKLLKFDHQGVKYLEIGDAIDLSQETLIAAGELPLSGEEEKLERILNHQFQLASRAILELYKTIGDRKKMDNFNEEFNDAQERDKKSVDRKRMAMLRNTALPKGDDLKKATAAATVPVILSVVDNTKGYTKRTLERTVDIKSSIFLGTMYLHGFTYKLTTTEGYSLKHGFQFFLYRERQHELTKDGVVFEKLRDTTSLKEARKKYPEKALELFLVVLNNHDSLVAVTCGYSGGTSAPHDFGELIRKPYNSNVIEQLHGEHGDTYINLDGGAGVPHEQLRWTDLEKGRWILPLPGNIAFVPAPISPTQDTASAHSTHTIASHMSYNTSQESFMTATENIHPPSTVASSQVDVDQFTMTAEPSSGTLNLQSASGNLTMPTPSLSGYDTSSTHPSAAARPCTPSKVSRNPCGNSTMPTPSLFAHDTSGTPPTTTRPCTPSKILQNPSVAVPENSNPPSAAVSHKARVDQTTAILGSEAGTILEPRPLPPSSASTPRPRLAPLPFNENYVSQQFAPAIPVSRAHSVDSPTVLLTPESDPGSPIPQAPLFPIITHLNGVGASLPGNPVPVAPPSNTIDCTPMPASASVPPGSHKANMVCLETVNLGSPTTTPPPPKGRFGFLRRSVAPPTPISPLNSPSSKAPARTGTSHLPEVTAAPSNSAALTASQNTPPTSTPPVSKSGAQRGKELPSSSAPKGQRLQRPVVTTPAPTSPEAESKLVTPAVETPQERKRNLPGAIEAAPEPKDNSWKGWMLRKAVRYVWGVPQYD